MIKAYEQKDWVFNSSHDYPSPEYTCLVIPQIDPGRDKYGEQSEPERRLMLLAWMMITKAGDLMLKELSRVKFVKVSDKSRIIDDVYKQLLYQCDDVIKELDKVKAQVKIVCNKRNRGSVIVTEATRQKLQLCAKVSRRSSFLLTSLGSYRTQRLRTRPTRFPGTQQTGRYTLSYEFTRFTSSSFTKRSR
jgi:hypothetical protein